ncbi:hypothetical protein BH09ACT7_BH09ACT7_59140 [soil metagenome]
MIRHRCRSAVTAILVGACLSLTALFGAASAGATPDDDRFAAAVAALGIPPEPGVSLPDVGHSICTMLSTGLQGSVNPVPVIRGVVSHVQAGGLSRAQAGGLVRAATDVYCPEHAALLGR